MVQNAPQTASVWPDRRVSTFFQRHFAHNRAGILCGAAKLSHRRKYNRRIPALPSDIHLI
jgi:hypothetical protein